MIKLKEKIVNIKDFVIILENLNSHKAPLLKEFHIKNKLNILYKSLKETEKYIIIIIIL